MARPRKKERWSVERRLGFIDFRLYWEGHVNRSDLVDFFAVSVPQASSDLALYQLIAPENAVYDKTRKAYVAGQKFKAFFFEPSADHYLAQLRLLASGLLNQDETWLSQLPPFSTLPILRRRLDAKTIRLVLQAIRIGSSIEVNYQSMADASPKWRRVAPHALGFDGFRWHARAWCETNHDFRDFVLARIVAARHMQPAQSDPALDAGWHHEVTLKIGPHPKLKDGARRAIELDYGMVNGVVEVRTRVCLASYMERHLGLDLDPAKTPPERQQIVLLNRKELEAARKASGGSGDDPGTPSR